MQETWKDIKGYEGIYQVSNYGNIKSINYRKGNAPQNLKQEISETGYFRVNLTKNGRRKKCFVHKLVAEMFICNENNYTEVNHKDENKLNNYEDNLEWCTRQYNLQYGTRVERMANGLKRPVIGLNINSGDMLYFNSLKEADKNGYDSNYIWQCCTGKKKSFKNYTWNYAAETTRSMRAHA